MQCAMTFIVYRQWLRLYRWRSHRCSYMMHSNFYTWVFKLNPIRKSVCHRYWPCASHFTFCVTFADSISVVRTSMGRACITLRVTREINCTAGKRDSFDCERALMWHRNRYPGGRRNLSTEMVTWLRLTHHKVDLIDRYGPGAVWYCVDNDT